MSTGQQTSSGPQLATLAEGVLADVERLIGEHIDLLRAEVKQELRQAAAGAASVGSGVGLAALGGVMTTLMVVHLLHRATRLPLWVCYGLVGGALGGAGAALVYSGGREIANLELAPRETGRALREDLAWAKEQARSARR